MALSTKATITNLDPLISVPAINFHGWTGWIPAMQQIGDRYRRLGQEGSNMQATGKESRQTTIDAWLATTSYALAATAVEQVELLQTRVCRVLDAWSRTIPRVRVLSSEASMRSAKGMVVTGTTVCTHVVLARLVVERLPDA